MLTSNFCKTMYRCIYLIILFLYRNPQYVIITSALSSESSLSMCFLQRGIVWRGFSKVVKLHTILRPVHVVLGIQSDPESEFHDYTKTSSNGDLRRHHPHYDVTVMTYSISSFSVLSDMSDLIITEFTEFTECKGKSGQLYINFVRKTLIWYIL